MWDVLKCCSGHEDLFGAVRGSPKHDDRQDVQRRRQTQE